MKTAKNILAMAVAAALFAVPATAVGAKGGQGKSKGKAKSGQGTAKGKGCAKAHSRGFQVKGTLVSITADDPATTDASEGTVTLTVTSANKHARNSGELTETYTVPAGDAFELKLGDDGTAVPAAGDRVKVKGRIAVTKKRCAAEGTSVADRYGTPDVTRVKISKPEVEPTATETETETEVPPAA